MYPHCEMSNIYQCNHISCLLMNCFLLGSNCSFVCLAVVRQSQQLFLFVAYEEVSTSLFRAIKRPRWWKRSGFSGYFWWTNSKSLTITFLILPPVNTSSWLTVVGEKKNPCKICFGSQAFCRARFVVQRSVSLQQIVKGPNHKPLWASPWWIRSSVPAPRLPAVSESCWSQTQQPVK